MTGGNVFTYICSRLLSLDDRRRGREMMEQSRPLVAALTCENLTLFPAAATGRSHARTSTSSQGGGGGGTKNKKGS